MKTKCLRGQLPNRINVSVLWLVDMLAMVYLFWGNSPIMQNLYNKFGKPHINSLVGNNGFNPLEAAGMAAGVISVAIMGAYANMQMEIQSGDKEWKSL